LIDLHAHDTFSFLDGSGTPEQVIARCKELGREVIAITNHDNLYSPPFYERDCKKEGIRYILGVEIRIVPRIEDKQRHKHHLTLLAKDNIGWANICKMVSFAYGPGQYYLPSIDFEVLEEHSEGVIALSGCQTSYLSEMVLSNDLTEAVRYTKWMKSLFGDRFWIEVIPIDNEEIHILAPAARALSVKFGVPVVLTNDVHFLEKGGEYLWKMLACMKRRETFHNAHEMPVSCYYMTGDEAWEHAKRVVGDYFTKPELLSLFSEQEKVAADCNVEIPKIGSAKSGESDPYAALVEKTRIGVETRGLYGKDYEDRLERELDLILRKNYSDYFLVVADIVNWAKNHDILVGPSRGSAACSLVAFCVGITETDPIKYDLVMERFLSEDRVDPPDIDIDFQNDRRANVLQYVHDRFGEDKVAHLATFVGFKGKNSLAETGKVFGIPRDEIEKVQNTLVARGSADARASFTIEDTFSEFRIARDVSERYPDIMNAKLLEGQIRHSGIHAAAVLICEKPLRDSTAVFTKDDRNIAMLDYFSSSYHDGLKMDLLGVEELAILYDLCDETGHEDDMLGFLTGLDLEDPYILDTICNNSLGIFQFGAPGTSAVTRQLGIDSFNDVVLANALSRPGPLHTRNTELITRAKNAGTRNNWGNALLDDICSATYGYYVYQEQVIRTCAEFGGMNYTDVAAIRNAMSKSLGDEFFNKYREIFKDGAERIHGIHREYSDKVFDTMATFGSWAFNKAHSVGYSLISYWTAFFKTYYSREFYKVLANHQMADKDKLRALLREFREKGLGEILPPKINKSMISWAIEGNDLRAGLGSILPDAAANEIVSLYPIENEADLEARAQRRKVNVRIWRIIEENRLFDEDAIIDPFGLYVFAERMGYVTDRTHQIGKLGYAWDRREVVVAGVMPKQINLKSIQELKDTVKLGDWRKRFDEKYGDEWAIIYLVDETGGPINVHIKNYLYPQYRDMLWSKKINEDVLVVQGIIPPSMNYVVADQIWEWNDRKITDAKCYKCNLIHNNFCPPSGTPNTKMVFLGMCPGEVEIREGRPFSGPAGRLLDEVFLDLGISRDQVWITNSCLCRPINEEGRNRDPEDLEIDACNDRLMAEIGKINPRVIVAMGKVAYRALSGEHASIGQIAGSRMSVNGYNCVPSYHPAAALYGDTDTIKHSIRQSIQYALEVANE